MLSVSEIKEHLTELNARLEDLPAQEIITWAVENIEGLYQTTAFGLTGLVTMDMISKMKSDRSIDLIFVDTLHHFKETLNLVDNVQKRYPSVKLHVYKPDGATDAAEFAQQNGEELWNSNETLYDYLVKVEPISRAYDDLHVKAVLTGRRKSQGAARGSLPIIEIVDDLIKINPLANWTFQQVRGYIQENNVPYNALLDQGYRSVGDYHSTVPVAEGEDERAGRWKGKAKTECGIHDTKRFAHLVKKQGVSA